MNILQINSIDSKGGAAKFVYRFKKRLGELGYTTSMFVGYKKSTDKDIFLINRRDRLLGIISRLIKRNLKGYVRGKISFLRANDIDLFYMNNLFSSAEYKKADIIHCHNLHGYYFNLIALEKISKEKPIIWTLHDLWAITGHCAYSFDCEKWQTGCGNCPYLGTYPALKWDNTEYLWTKKKKIYNNSKLNIVVNSLWIKNKIEKSILKNQNIHLIYNGVDEEIFKQHDKKEVREILNLPKDKKIVIFSAVGGKNDPRKGWEYVQKISAYYKKNKNLLFLCIGGRKNSREFDDNVRYVEYIDNDSLLAQYYSAADLLICPSLADTFGLVAAESLSCGTPVVAFDAGGIPEIVTHKKHGYIAEYKNIKDLIDGIEYILGLSKNEVKRISQDSIQRIRENFTLNIMTNNYLKLYQKILGFRER